MSRRLRRIGPVIGFVLLASVSEIVADTSTFNLSGWWQQEGESVTRTVRIEQHGSSIIASFVQPTWCSADGLAWVEPSGPAQATTEWWSGSLRGDAIDGMVTTSCEPREARWVDAAVPIKVHVTDDGLQLTYVFVSTYPLHEGRLVRVSP